METWKEEIKNIIDNGCTDSDIEDYVFEHPEINGTDIWNYVCEYIAPKECRGCKYIQYSGMYPCNACTRQVKLQDFYAER